MKKAHTNTKHTEITYRQLFEYINFHKISIDDPITIQNKDENGYIEFLGVDKLAISDEKEFTDNIEENTCILIPKIW